jgi:hypothetical protein
MKIRQDFVRRRSRYLMLDRVTVLSRLVTGSTMIACLKLCVCTYAQTTCIGVSAKLMDRPGSMIGRARQGSVGLISAIRTSTSIAD